MIYLLVAPYNVTIHGSTSYFYGDILELSCISKGSPQLHYSWSREVSGGNMFSAGTIIINNTIIIYNLTINDEGIYLCSVGNEAGNSTSMITVDVISKLLYTCI